MSRRKTPNPAFSLAPGLIGALSENLEQAYGRRRVNQLSALQRARIMELTVRYAAAIADEINHQEPS